MRKILVLSYYFPPCAKAGAHRAYSMAEFLPKFGWQPIFIAPDKGYYGRLSRYDYALLRGMGKFETIRVPFFYPCNNKNNGAIARLIRRLWETILIPDGKVLWNHSVKNHIDKIVDSYKPDAIFITGTPFSSFLLAPYIKKKYGLPIILDYRDPWADNIGANNTYLRKQLDFILEKKAFMAADLITTASYYIIDYIKQSLGNLSKGKEFFGFPYGFDSEFFKHNILSISNEKSPHTVRATFAGAVHGDLDAELILKGIQHAANDFNFKRKLRVTCYGTLFGSSNNVQSMINKHNLNEIVELKPFLPYKDFLIKLRQSSFLILPHGESSVAKALYPTKFFDYLGVKRPIIYIGGKSQVAETINILNAGVCSRAFTESIAKSFSNMFYNYRNHNWYSNPVEYSNLSRYNIFEEFCRKLIKL